MAGDRVSMQSLLTSNFRVVFHGKIDVTKVTISCFTCINITGCILWVHLMIYINGSNISI